MDAVSGASTTPSPLLDEAGGCALEGPPKSSLSSATRLATANLALAEAHVIVYGISVAAT